MRGILTAAIAAALGAAISPAEAVLLNPRGTGQVLIYSYYTVNHQQTLVSVINTTARGKALKVRFREAYDGRDVANFNLYLGPYDSWVGAVYDTSGDSTGAAAIATNDNSCTVPAFPLAPVPGTLHALTFGNVNYSQGAYGMATGTDNGPTNLARTREGFFEMIEMGEVVDQAIRGHNTLEAITPVGGNPPDCAQVRNAWKNDGYWNAYPTTDLLPPAGGLYGSAGIVDVALGTLYAYNATAIDGFSDVVQNTRVGDAKPNLSTAITDSSHDIATAYVPIGNPMIKADYPAAARAIDAVSGVLTAGMLANEYVTDPRVGASSEWVITFPTKQFYVDPGIVGFQQDNGALPPFETGFDIYSCSGLTTTSYDREGNPLPTGVGFPEPPITGGNYLCYESQLITFNQSGVEPGIPTMVFGSLLGSNYDVYSNGWFALSFEGSAKQLRASLEGNVFLGLPAIGFLAVNYINANVTPGVLSNYSGVYPHRSTATCTNATNPQSACQ